MACEVWLLTLQSRGPGAVHTGSALWSLRCRSCSHVSSLLQVAQVGLTEERMLKLPPEREVGSYGAEIWGRRAFQPEEAASAETRRRE